MSAFEQWKKGLALREQDVVEAKQKLEEARSVLDAYLEESVGFKSTSTATLSGTIEMISKIIDMKKAEAP